MTQESPPPDVPPRLSDYTPAQKFVYDKLQQMEPATQRQLAEQTQLPVRTIRYALTALRDAEEVMEVNRQTGDARKRWYTTVSPDTDSDE